LGGRESEERVGESAVTVDSETTNRDPEGVRQGEGVGVEGIEVPELTYDLMLVADFDQAACDRDAVEVTRDVDVGRAEPDLRSQLAQPRTECSRAELPSFGDRSSVRRDDGHPPAAVPRGRRPDATGVLLRLTFKEPSGQFVGATSAL
jgi:hypothetical protein